MLVDVVVLKNHELQQDAFYKPFSSLMLKVGVFVVVDLLLLICYVVLGLLLICC